jgi:hypothetical protein
MGKKDEVANVEGSFLNCDSDSVEVVGRDELVS